MAVLDRLSFLQQLPTLMKATSDDEAPCPGYVLEEIAQMSHESAGGRQCLLEYLLHRLQSQSCHMKLKVLKILLYLCAHGSSHFLQALRRNATFIQEVTVFSGPPDPLHGNSLYQKVRAMAQDLASTLFADALWPQPSALPPRPLPPTGMGSRCHDGSALQGFGYTQECADPGESLLSTIQKVAGVMSSAVLPGPDLSGHSKPEEEVYQPVMAPPPGVSRSVREALPTVTTHTRASRQPGLAGGGWEESDSGHSSQRSSQENCDSGQTSGSGSDGHSGASREVGDLTERVEFAHLSDCTQEMSLVDTVTRGTKVFLTREEVQHFVKECALLNCEAVLELLNRTLQDPSTSVQMLALGLLDVSLCTMQSARSSASFQGGGDGLDLSLTGSQLSVSRRPSSASPAKQIARSISVFAENKAKKNTPEDAGLASSRAINNLRRSNSTTQVNPRVSSSLSSEPPEDFLALFGSSSNGRRKLASLSKVSPEKKTTWNILDEQPRVFPIPPSARSGSSVESRAGMRKRETTVPLAPNFTANNRSNKGAVGNCVTTMLHNNYSTSDTALTPKSSNQKASSLNNIIKATSREGNEKNFTSHSNVSRNNTGSSGSTAGGSGGQPKRTEVSEEEAERFIQQVNHAAVTIQRWYRRHSLRRRAGTAALRHMLATKKEEKQQQQAEEGSVFEVQRRKEEDRKKIREEKARQARIAAIQELRQKRAQKSSESKQIAEEELQLLKDSGIVGKKKPTRATSLKNTSPTGSSVKANNAGLAFQSAADLEGTFQPCDAVSPPLDKKTEELKQDPREMNREEPDAMVTASQAQSKTTLHDLLDTLKLLEEDPELPPEPRPYKKDKYAWIDEETDSNSLTTDNLERFGQMTHSPALPDDGALLSEAKLQSIISFLDEMEKSEQERPRSEASNAQREGLLSEEEVAHLEQASAVATEVTSSMMKLRLEVEEKKRVTSLLQTALAQQRELTVRHVKEAEKELNHQLKLQREQYEGTIQRHLSFIDQLIDDKKVLSEKCESVVLELKQVDQKYSKRISQMQEQHELEIKKLKELMNATEKVRREKWIDEKTKKIKEITVKGLEPEIQKLIAKHKQEIKKLKALHEAELLQSDERAAQRYVRQTEELRENLEREKEELSQRERELARQRYEKQLEQEEQSLQQQRRRLYSEVSEEKERLGQQASRQRAELDELRRQLEENCSLSNKALKEEFEKSKEEQERRHQAETKALKERLEIEKQAWEENYMKKEEAWLLSRERELKEEVRKGRDKEIELVIQRLEAEMSTTKEECERAAENRIKRVRDKYEAELQELERSERKLQERCNGLKGRLAEAEGNSIRLQGLLRQKEEEAEDIRKVKDRLTDERNSLSEVIRQEFADKLVLTEEENKRLKTEASEMRARHRLELERISREKEEELEEVHKRVKTAIVKKEEAVNSLRKQYEAALKRADHLEALLDQQRKQLLTK